MTGLEPATSGVTGRHSNQLSYTRAAMYVRFLDYLKSLVYQHFPCLSQAGNSQVARVTGLEPATSGVTGRHSNQLSYTRVLAVASAWEAALYVSTGCLSTHYSRPGKIFATTPRLACGQFRQPADFREV